MKAVVYTVHVGRAVIYCHFSVVVVLVESFYCVCHCQAVFQLNIVVGVASAYLEAVTVADVWIAAEAGLQFVAVSIGDGDGLAELVKPALVCFASAVVREVVVVWAVLIAYTVNKFRRCRTVADSLEEVPTVIRVVPCPATYICIGSSCILLVCKSVGITAEVGSIEPS